MDEFDPARPLMPLSPHALAELRSLVRQMQEVEGSWYEQYGSGTVEPGVYLSDHAGEDRLIHRSSAFLYAQQRIMIMDWTEWVEGDPLMKRWTNDSARALNHFEVRKYLSYISRLDHWSDDAWEEMFEGGQGLQLFARLLELEEELAAST